MEEALTVAVSQINIIYGMSIKFNFVSRADGFLAFRDNLTPIE
ncbi:MAG: hypothetical protein JW384_04026 [Nitrosomonadaceae bacterium]|nr:hypothetical protein [Nitrosomonadaceae bacterium]